MPTKSITPYVKNNDRNNKCGGSPSSRILKFEYNSSSIDPIESISDFKEVGFFFFLKMRILFLFDVLKLYSVNTQKLLIQITIVGLTG
jgi:hypothetical protein